jgi:hypothetical protein
MTKTLFPMLACLLMASCGDKDNFHISAPDKMLAGKSADVAVSGTFDSGVKISWTTTAGHFEGPNDALSAKFVAPESGSATLICTIVRPGHKIVALDKQITVASAPVAGAPAGGGAPPGPPVQARGPMEIENVGFIPSGWMGDTAGLKVDPKSKDRPHSAPNCQQWSYSPTSDKIVWAAVAWQFPEMNWGDRPGKDLSTSGFRQVSVWARGVKDSSGTLPKLQFKAGGATAPTNPYHASFEVVGDFVTLTEDWKQYTLDLRGQNLSQVVAAFVVVIRAQDVGPKGATFYLDDIEYQ